MFALISEVTLRTFTRKIDVQIKCFLFKFVNFIDFVTFVTITKIGFPITFSIENLQRDSIEQEKSFFILLSKAKSIVKEISIAKYSLTMYTHRKEFKTGLETIEYKI